MMIAKLVIYGLPLIFLLLLLSILYFAVRNPCWRKQVTDFFVVKGRREKHIFQSFNSNGRKYFRRIRRLSKGEPIQSKLASAAVTYYHQLKRLIKVLNINEKYYTHTHLIQLIEKTSELGYLTYTYREAGKGLIFFETITVLGLIDALKILFSKRCCTLIRTFYNVEFTVLSKPNKRSLNISIDNRTNDLSLHE